MSGVKTNLHYHIIIVLTLTTLVNIHTASKDSRFSQNKLHIMHACTCILAEMQLFFSNSIILLA